MKEVYRLNDGYCPRIFEKGGDLIYFIPVDSGAVSISCEFLISKQDFEALKSSAQRYKCLFFVLHYEIQSTFGIGHSNPRQYRQDEFELVKKQVLYCSEEELEAYIREYCVRKNFGYEYFLKFVSYLT